MQDPRDTTEIFARQMPFIFKSLLEDRKLLHFVQQLLLAPTVSRHFATMMFNYLLDNKLTKLAAPDSEVRP